MGVLNLHLGLGLRLCAGATVYIVLTELCRDEASGRRIRLVGDTCTVGTKVGDVTILIQGLCELHGLAGGEAEGLRRLLLHRRGREWQRCLLTTLGLPDVIYDEIGVSDFLKDGIDLSLRAQCLLLLATVEASRQLLLSVQEDRIEGPVLLRYESRDLSFTITDHAKCHGLYTTGRETLTDFLP